MRLAFVSAPGGSAFMEELLAAVADAVTRVGGRAVCHRGDVADLADSETVFIVVPHEYFVINGVSEPDLLRRTIGFGVEHPGTATFEVARKFAALLAGSVAIGDDAVAAMRHGGVRAERFVLGYSPMWDRRSTNPARDIDVLYLGTADERRLGQLAGIVPDLAGVRTELLLPPHEPMTRPRPDFVMGAQKWELLARSRLLVNLHREGATAFEWVRALEAMANGCVVLTSPSTGLHPLVPGEHLLVSDPRRMGLVARAALADPDLLSRLAGAADELCRSLDMLASARRLVDLAESVVTAPTPRRREAPSLTSPPDEPPMAQWVPCELRLPNAAEAAQPELAAAVREAARGRSVMPPGRIVSDRVSNGMVDVVCVSGPADGPLALTMASLDSSSLPTSRFVLVSDDAVSDGLARNALVLLGSAPYLLVVNAGDELFGDPLAELVAILDAEDSVEVAYPMALLGSSMIGNALAPEARRLRQFAYLSRGYLVRRSWLAELGGFGVEPELDGYTDHDFWQRTARMREDAARLVRRVGIRLWPREALPGLAQTDPVGVRAVLERRAASVTHETWGGRGSSGHRQLGVARWPGTDNERRDSHAQQGADDHSLEGR